MHLSYSKQIDVYDLLHEFWHINLFIGERGLMLDAFALLGGNENLVQQLINRLVDTDYS